MLSLILADGALYADLEEPDMIKPPVVYVAGMLRQTGTYITTDDWVWMLDQMGQRPFYPPNVSGWEQNEAWLSTSSLRMRFQAAASLLRDAIEDGAIPQTRTPAEALERSLAYRRAAVDEQGDDLGARVLQPAQRRRPGREVGGQALLARARARAAPGPAGRSRRAGLLMPRGLQRLARHARAARAAWPGGSCRSRSDALRRAGGVRAPAAGCRAATCWRAASACWSRPTAFPASRRAACSRRPPRRPRTRRTPRSSSRSTSTAATTASTRSSRSATRATRELRSRIGIDPATALPLAGRPSFGWHPSLAGLRELYDAGKVAVLPAVDYSHPDQSHFNSGGFWRSGIVGPAPDRSGWLGRTLDVIGTHDNPLQGIHVGWGQDPSLIGHRAPVATVSSPADFGFYIPDVWEEKSFLPIYRRLSRARAKHPALAAVRVDVRQHDRDPRPARAAGQGGQARRRRRALPGHQPRQGARQPRRACSARASARASRSSRSGGFDTHDAQAEAHAELLQDLGDSLRAWQADLDARGLSERVLTLIWSEFGRRPEDNDSGGTDHGAGGLLLLVGNRANGGIRSEFPGLGAPRRRRQPDRHHRLPHASTRRCSRSGSASRPARVLPRVPGGHLPLLRAAA